ncbi:SDR family oxidoreductase [Nitratireductor aquimarinus]|uniref:SDR family oxidoreductase n=1 Tax=Nitratireductor TaxID=245876 RepID=UPI0019D400DC|nr:MULTISPECIES: SDR family oxidoreductase [Nitratireductor]MBN7776248.1 SDR family oxidoreductase [Nitratireductor pacificus]MBN7779115.1 SDR family oxidoreductase [Nitratireductor pacificus]MBN7787922.1 SDR family oxidoreductase [Nitratireductor aquimarinus]MBY6097969.1 SDR family oxidoreductase [Nitratireductor aquimarinus]MCA1259843.1 SDR family oxidoreductase [Nitratireductor aquimarinus]
MKLTGKTALITGGAQGIGYGIASLFHAEGARIEVLDRNGDQLAKAFADKERVGLHVADMCSENDLAAVFENTGRVDVLVNCAGMVLNGNIEACSRAELEQSLSLNVVGSYEASREAIARAVTDEKPLSIINIASIISSVSAAPNRFAYGTSKAAMIGMTKSIAVDYVRKGVRCNAICPGTIDSPSLQARIADAAEAHGGLDKAQAYFNDRQPIGRLGTVAEVADLALYLASDGSGFMTGAVLNLDGGFSL